MRMDKAWIGSVDIAINKAWTARAFDISTKELAELFSRATSSSEFMPPITAGS